MAKRILVVEDNDLNRKLFCDVLKSQGYAVEPCADGLEALGKARESIRARWPDAPSRRWTIDNALAEGAVLDPLSGAGAAEVPRWLGAMDGNASVACRLEEIVIRSDDPDELTVRVARLLGQADVVFHAPAVAPAILDRARADAARVSITHIPDWAGPGLAIWLHRESEI